MRFANLYIAGTGTWLPGTVTVEEAEAAGQCQRRHLWRTEFTSVCVSESESGPEMAARAAQAAIQQAGCDPSGIDLILHANAYYQGHEMFAPTSYIQRVASGSNCPAIEVRQMSNGGLAALDLAASYLLADPARSHALVTTGDRFCLPGFDRWYSDLGTVYADGGTALVLSAREGFARLHSLVTIADSSLEGMQRGAEPFGAAPFIEQERVDIEVRRKAFVNETGIDTVLERIDSGQWEALKRALSDAETELADIAWFVLPNLGRGRLDAHFLDKFRIDPDRTTWQWGRRIGHLGAGDQIAGLHHLVESGTLQPGQRCLLAGVGAGFSWSCAVVELLSRP